MKSNLVINKLKKPEVLEELKSVKLISLILMFALVVLSILERYLSNTWFSFFGVVEVGFIFMIFRAYIKSLNKLNYGLWGFSFIIFLILLKNIINFSFLEYNQFAIFLTLFSFTMFGINSYVMSSPIYYPRVQWWEYDYKFRADLKIKIKIGEDVYDARLTDFRRSEASIEMFEVISLENEGTILLEYDNDSFELNFSMKNFKSIIRGRPNRYGLKISKKSKDFNKVKSLWSKNKSIKLRRKFK